MTAPTDDSSTTRDSPPDGTAADASVPPRGNVRRLGRLRRLVALVRPHRARFALATVALLVGSGIGLVYPQAARWAIDHGLGEGSLETLNQIGLGLILLFVLHAGVVWVRHYLMSWLGERAVADLRRMVFDRLVLLPSEWFHQRRTGELIGRLSSDVTVIENLVGSQLSIALRNAVQLVGGLVLLIIESPSLTLMILAVVPPLSVGVVLFGRQIRKMSKRVQDRLADTSGQAQESLGAIQTVQAFVRESFEAARYGEGVERAFGESVRLARWRASFMSLVTVAGYIAVAAVLWLGGRAVVAGEMSGGDLAAFMLYTSIVGIALGSLAGLWGMLQRAAGATERLFEVIDTTPTIRDPADPVALPAGGGAVRFESVSFTYPARPEHPVLSAVDFEVAPGEVVAAVGPSGAGKTTLTALLLRFYDVDQGAVTFEGVDVRRMRLSELRGAMSMVAQEPVLFSGTIAENIAYGRVDATAEAIERAARDANAHDFVSAFPHGYDTLVGERGVRLSGGQRQRIAIARALLADPRLLILDEATSNLDSESEALVQEALSRLMESRTTFVIAHRLSTVRDADRILVFDGGRLVETGDHETLMARGGIYRRLVERQLTDENGGAEPRLRSVP